MAISFRETLGMKCHACRVAFPADAWLIVDAEERPDLWQYCKDGTIHTVHCPNGHATYLGVSLLLHDGARRAVLFSPFSPSLARYPTKDDLHQLLNEISHIANSLMQRLDAALPATAPRDYLRMVQIVPREDLTKALAEITGRGSAQSPDPELAERLAERAMLAERIDAPYGEHEMPARIELIRSALATADRNRDPGRWAFLQWRLGTSLGRNAAGDPDENVEQAIAAFNAGLTVYTRDERPEAWADLKINLSTMYLRRTAGSTEENLKATIAAAEDGLTWYTEQRSPEQWELAAKNRAEAKRRLALELEHPGMLDFARKRYGRLNPSRQGPPAPRASRDRPPTGRLKEVFARLSQLAGPDTRRERIQLTEEALELVDPAADPALWATLQAGLAEHLLGDRADGDEAEFARAVAAYRAGLGVLNPRAHPREWAALYLNLGAAYYNRSDGDREQNLLQAIETFQEALQVPNYAGAEGGWGRLQYNLGLALLERRAGDSDRNLGQAVSALRKAQSVFSREADPRQWAKIQFEIGRGYRETSTSNAVKAIEEAIGSFEEALKVFRRQHFPVEWAQVQCELGYLYGHRLRSRIGEQPDNYERAIDAYAKAQTVFTREEHPKRWAAIQLELAWPYRYREEGDPADNQERGLEAVRNALTVYTRDAYPHRWASSQMALGVAYSERRYGDPDENRALAIRAFEAAQTVFTPDADPLRWATAEAEIGLVHLRAADHDQAITYVQRAIGVYEANRPFLGPAGVINLASFQLNLGQLYQMRKDGSREENLERAIDALEAALGALSREQYPGRWAGAHELLAGAYLDRVRGERTENVRRAAEHARAALESHPPEAGSMESYFAVESFARAQAELGQWSDVFAILEPALKAAERFYTASLTEATRTEAIQRDERLYQLMVEACLRLEPPRPREAFLYAEEGRSRLLRDQLGTLALPAPDGVPESVLALERDLLRRLRSFQGPSAPALHGPDRRAAIDALADTRERLAALWDTMRRRHFADEYVALRRGEGVAWDDVVRWLAEQPRAVAVLAFYSLADGLVAFVVRRGEAEPVVRRLTVPADHLTLAAQRFIDLIGARSRTVEKAPGGLERGSRQSGTLPPPPLVHPLNRCSFRDGSGPEASVRPMAPSPAPDEGVTVRVPVGVAARNHRRPCSQSSAFPAHIT